MKMVKYYMRKNLRIEMVKVKLNKIQKIHNKLIIAITITKIKKNKKVICNNNFILKLLKFRIMNLNHLYYQNQILEDVG